MKKFLYKSSKGIKSSRATKINYKLVVLLDFLLDITGFEIYN